MAASTMTPTPAATAGPSTEGLAAGPALARTPQIGEVVLVTVDAGPRIRRPLMITRVDVHTVEQIQDGAKVLVTTARVSGTLFCEPDDYARNFLRGAYDRAGDPARVEGRPSKVNPVAYGYKLGPGTGVGQWEFRP